MTDRSDPGEPDRRARWTTSPLRVFISHNVDEAGAAALRLADDLELLGCAVWLASKDIAPGEQWSPRLQEAIEQSTHVIALLVAGQASGWVRYELGVALDRSMGGNLTLVPVIAGSEAVLPPLLTGFHAVDISRSYSTGLRELSGVLGVRDALTTAESAIMERWEAGRVQLDRHRNLLHQQLSNLRGVLDAEQRRLDSHTARAESARQKAAAAEAEAAASRAQAQQATERAQELSAAAAKAAAEVDVRDGRVAGLTVRLSELHAAHDPVLELIDRAHRFLEQRDQLSPLEMARDQDVATLLERPETVLPVGDVAVASRSPREYVHRHRIAGALLDAVGRSSLTGSDYEAVLERGLQAIDAEFPDLVELPADYDDAHLKDLEDNLARAVARHAEQPDAHAGLGLSQALQLAFVGYASGLEYPAHQVPAAVPVDMVAPVDTVVPADTAGEPDAAAIAEPAPVDPGDRFDVILIGVEPGSKSRSDLLVGHIFSLMGTSPQPIDVSGFFDVRRLVRNGPFPAVIVRGADRNAAAGAESMLSDHGARVALRPHAGPPRPGG